jgi:hypothetical protein
MQKYLGVAKLFPTENLLGPNLHGIKKRYFKQKTSHVKICTTKFFLKKRG